MNLFVHLKGCYDSARKLVRFNCFARNKGDNSDSEKYILFLFQWRMDSFPMKATSQMVFLTWFIVSPIYTSLKMLQFTRKIKMSTLWVVNLFYLWNLAEKITVVNCNILCKICTNTVWLKFSIQWLAEEDENLSVFK
jgi:hypothetical protein